MTKSLQYNLLFGLIAAMIGKTDTLCSNIRRANNRNTFQKLALTKYIILSIYFDKNTDIKWMVLTSLFLIKDGVITAYMVKNSLWLGNSPQSPLLLTMDSFERQ